MVSYSQIINFMCVWASTWNSQKKDSFWQHQPTIIIIIIGILNVTYMVCKQQILSSLLGSVRFVLFYIGMVVLSIILSVILLSVCACVRAFMWFCSHNIVLSLQHNYRIWKVLVTLIVFNKQIVHRIKRQTLADIVGEKVFHIRVESPLKWILIWILNKYVRDRYIEKTH